MWYFNLTLNSLFNVMLAPFQHFHPFWPLLVISLVAGIVMLMIFRYTSNQVGIKKVKDKIKAHIIEIRLFNDNAAIFFSAVIKILYNNVKYMGHMIKPLLVMIAPVAIILIQIDGWFGYRPLKIGEAAIVSVKVSEEGMEMLSNISITADKGLIIETHALRIPGEREVDWRIRAIGSGEQKVTINVSNQIFQKNIKVSNDKLVRVSQRVVTANLWDTILNPGEKPITRNSLVEKIEVNYPSRSVEVLGWNTHWFVLFLGMSIILGFSFKGFMKVEI